MSDYAQLPTSFMLTSIIGFFVSWFVVYDYSPSYAVAFMVVFIIMFIASMVSMTKSDIESKDLLYLHSMKRVKKEFKPLHQVRPVSAIGLFRGKPYRSASVPQRSVSTSVVKLKTRPKPQISTKKVVKTKANKAKKKK